MIQNNFRTYTIKLPRIAVVHMLTLLDSVMDQDDPTTKWSELHDRILSQFIEQDEKNGIA